MNLAVFFGGLIGLLATHSFIGLIVGAIAGFYLPYLLKRGAVSTARRVRNPFVESTFAVMGAVCKADGRVSEEEIRVVEGLFDRFRLDPTAREIAKAAFTRGKDPDFDLDAEVENFLRLSRGQRVLHMVFIQVQLAAMMADGRIQPAEHDILLRIARGLGISEAEIVRLEAMFTGGGAWSGWERAGSTSGGQYHRTPTHDDLEAAYAVIGVKPTDTDDTVKRAYRRLMSENHPDKLAAQGLPDSMLEMAKRKTQDITAAYQLIEKARAATRSRATA